jgi:hypothetical protein
VGTNIKARKKLSALYVRGVEIRFGPSGAKTGPFKDDEPLTDEEVAVWVQPPSPLHREMALRDANASRARSLLNVRRNPESEEALTANAFVSEMSDDTLIEYVLDFEAERRRNEAIREVLAREEWKDIEALRDAMRQYEDGDRAEDPDDPEWVALMQADKRYGDDVFERSVELYEADKEAIKMLGRAAWERRAIEKRTELAGSQVFLTEYERQMCFYSVRTIEDHGVLFFESVREFSEQDDVVRDAITTALTQFIQDAMDPKASPGEGDGSTQSTPPNEPETSESSTPGAPTE